MLGSEFFKVNQLILKTFFIEFIFRLECSQVLEEVDMLLLNELDNQPNNVLAAPQHLLLDDLLEVFFDVLVSSSRSDSSLAGGR